MSKTLIKFPGTLTRVFLLLLISSTASAQFKYDFPQFFTETGHYFTTPLHWDGSDGLTFGALLAGTGIAMATEGQQRNINFSARTDYNSVPVKIGNFYGGPFTPFILFAGYGGYSLITGDLKARKIGYELGQSLIYAGLITTALKYVVGRARPYADQGKLSFHTFTDMLNDANHSFPSGHVTEAFAMSTVLAMNTDQLWLKILAYVPAAFTPYARVYQGMHWISDCIMGAGIGYFSAKWCGDAHAAPEDGESRSSIRLESVWPLSVSIALN